MAEKLDTYYKYRSTLERMFCLGNNEKPSDSQLQCFIKENQLDTEFKITLAEVKNDIDDLFYQHSYENALTMELLPIAAQGISDITIRLFVRKHNFDWKFKVGVNEVRQKIVELKGGGTWVKPPITSSKLFGANVKYKATLISAINTHLPEPLTDIQLRIFIKKNKYDTLYGITLDDVRSDMYILKPEYQPSIFVSNADGYLYTQYLKSDCSSHADSTDAETQYNTGTRSIVTNQDTEFEREFTEVLLRHQNILNDKRRFSALMKDIFPTKKAEVNILALILELGIVDEIQESECIDTMYVFRIAKRLSSEYGTDSEFAKRMAQMWCTCYRRNILHKECNL